MLITILDIFNTACAIGSSIVIGALIVKYLENRNMLGLFIFTITINIIAVLINIAGIVFRHL